MFTGIVEETGHLTQSQPGDKSVHLTIQASRVLEGTQLGDSVATNGVCLTVVKLGENTLTVDVMSETLKHTNLGTLKAGDLVNLERSLTPSSRLGGHFVTGHVDGTGVITNIVQDGIAQRFFIRLEEALTASIIVKGSIAIDGISLTVVGLSKTHVEVSLIPHTQAVTTWADKRVGDTVNIETDMIGKYVEKIIQGKKDVSPADLEKWGY